MNPVMALKKGQILELFIEKMAFGGPGMGLVDGFVVFVPASAPGDKVRVKVYKKKRDYGEARILEILEPSVARVPASCPYYPHCGGCQWQHIGYRYQLKYKMQQVREAMERIGGMGRVQINEIIPSDEITGYRNKMEFSFSSRRWALPSEMPIDEKGRGFALGLHVPGTYDKVIDIASCLLQQEQGNVLLRLIRHETEQSGLPPYNIKIHQGFWRYLTIRHSRAFDQWMVNMVTWAEHGPVMNALAQKLTATLSNVTSVINNVSKKKAGVAVGDYEKIIQGQATIQERIGPYLFQISANSFFQTNTAGAERLYGVVAKYAQLSGKETVLDLYSGTGTIPIYLSSKAGQVIGIEISKAAVEDAIRNCELNRVDNVTFVQGDIRDQLPLLRQKPDLLIIDPPRTGMHKHVVKQVLDLVPNRIIYVSCNPTTLARDIALLQDRYELIELQPVDLFPHTYHVETVALLAKRVKVG